MTYACDDCGFLFCRITEVPKCPLCEGAHIRRATEEERKTLGGYLSAREPVLIHTDKIERYEREKT